MTDHHSATQFQILGPLIATSPERGVLRFGGTTQRRLLTALLVNTNTVVPADRLSDWCELSPGALRTTISRLRKILGPDTIFLESPGYILRTASLDALDFERLVEESRSAAPAKALARLDTALALWGGDALADFADEVWAQATAVSLSELRASAIEERAEILIWLGRPADAIVAMERHVGNYPLRERPRELLMRALAAEGRQPEALRQFQAYRHYLIEEIGTEPTDELRALEAKIVAGWRDPSAGERVHVVPGNLGVQTTSFVGRDTEVKEVAELVRQHRLVTLTGVGGVGKTRLAVQVASGLASEFDDGVWLAELGPVGDPRSVPDAVATALGVTVQPGLSVTSSIADALVGRQVLIVLDNCEHVLDASANLIENILSATSDTSILATSREGMRVGSEHLWPVPSLGIDEGAASAAVTLFAARAEQVNPAFSLHTGDNLDAVIEICRRLDGIALAIELAAARMVSMTPAEVSARLNDRFRLLSGSRRGLERHQTLRHAVRWSYDLLTTDEQTLLGACSVFAGGSDLPAVTAVADRFDEFEILDGLDSLVRKSLLATKQVGGRTRYWMLETIRHFAEEQHGVVNSGESEGLQLAAARDQHAAYFAGQSVAQFEAWGGPHMQVAADWLEQELDNLRAGFRWATERGDIDSAVAIAAHAPMIAFGLQRLEPVAWAEEVIAAATEAKARQLPRLLTAASLCSYLGRAEDALAYAQASAALHASPDSDPFDRAWVGFREAVAELDNGRADRYLQICGELAGEPGLSHVVGLCGLVAFLPSVGRADEAMPMAEQAMDAAVEHGNPYWIAFAHVGYGRAFAQSDPTLAMEKLREGLGYAQQHPIPYWEAVFAREAGGLEAVHGDPAQALDLLNTSLDSFHQAGNTATLGWTLASLAVLFSRIGDKETAATIAGTTARYPIADLILGFSTAVEQMQAALGTPVFEQCSAAGEAMDVAQAVHYATIHISQARAELTAG